MGGCCKEKCIRGADRGMSIFGCDMEMLNRCVSLAAQSGGSLALYKFRT